MTNVRSPDAKTPPLLAATAVPPWPSSDGYSLRAGHLLSELATRWKVTVVSPARDDSRHASSPEGIEWVRIPGVPATNILPWREERTQFIEGVRDQVRSRHFAAACLWNGTEFVASEIHGFPRAVADRIDCETLQAVRSRRHSWWSFRRKLQELRRGYDLLLYERRVLRKMRGVVATTSADARALERITGHGKVRVVPNGVVLPDLHEYPDENPVPTVIFTGVLAYPPNAEAVRYFVENVWPSVRDEVPEARFVIAGRSPVPELIQAFSDRPGVEIRPDVEDVTEEIRKAWVAVAPMRSGSGVKNKVLEAWAAERPVALSRLACQGLEVTGTLDELVADTASAMSSLVVALLRQPDRRRRFGQMGREFVSDQHGWQAAAEPLHELVDEVIVSSEGGTPDSALAPDASDASA